MIKMQKVLLTGRTRTTIHSAPRAPSGEPQLDIHLDTPNDSHAVHSFASVQPHPTAEQLFAGAWSACYITALGVVAKTQKVSIPDDVAVNIEVDLGIAGSAYLLQARLHVVLPGLTQSVAEAVAHAADEICPYSKATRGNIDVSLTVVGS